MISILSIPVR